MRLRSTVLSVVLSAMSATVVGQPNELANRAQKLAVAVLAGAELKLLQLGVLVFGNAYGKVEIPDDRIAAAIYESVRAHLTIEGRVLVHRLPVDRTDLAALADKAYKASNDMWGPNLKELSVEVSALRSRCDCDALLIVAERRQEVIQTNQFYRGITWHGARAPGAHLMMPLVVYLVDPGTGNTVATGRTEYMGALVKAPWPEKPGEVKDLDPSTWDALAQSALNLRRALRPAMHRIGMRPSCTQHYYELHTPAYQRNSMNSNYIEPPATPAGADPARCQADEK